MTSVTDPNGALTKTSYGNDPYFWRPDRITDALNNTTYYNYYGVSNNPGGSAVTAIGQVESVMTFNSSLSTVDTLSTPEMYGRPYLQQTREAPGSGSWDTISYLYDGASRVALRYQPYVSAAGVGSSSGPSIGYTYDAAGRVLDMTDSDGGDAHYTYKVNDVEVTLSPAPQNENTKSRQLQYDALGRVVSVCEMTSMSGSGACTQNTAQNGFVPSYTYDPLGHLLSVSQGGQTRSFSYDGLSRMLANASRNQF